MNQKKNQGSRRPVMLYHADNQVCTTCKAPMYKLVKKIPKQLVINIPKVQVAITAPGH
jgi:hypothetical protein